MTAPDRPADGPAPSAPAAAGASRRPPRRRPPWLAAPILAAAVLSVASGFAQFSVTALAGDVAEHFGAPGPGDDLASQIGLTATTLGVALALIRLASLASLPATAVADRFGRRRVLLASVAIGLTATALAATAPLFWVYVVIVAFARPWLSTTNAVAGVVAAEESTSRSRSSAVALIGASYALGAGLIAVLRGVLPGDPSFRLVTALAVVPLALLPLIARRVHEPAIYTEHTPASRRGIRWIPGAVPAEQRRKLLLLCLVTAGMSIATGPGFTYLFVYGEQVLGASPGAMSVLVLSAGPAGLIGLLAGRWASDHLGRRLSAAVAMAATAAALVVTYRGSFGLLATGYLVGIATSGAFGPPAGALLAEAFPTKVRATAAGWAAASGVLGAVIGLAGFGVLADAVDSFEGAVVTLAIPVALISLAFAGLPETRGFELDEVV